MNWKENNLIRRVIMAFLGNYIISFGISFLYAADFGTDPGEFKKLVLKNK